MAAHFSGAGVRACVLPGSGQRGQRGQSGQSRAGDGVMDQQQHRQRDQHGRVDDHGAPDEAKDKQQHAPGAHGPQLVTTQCLRWGEDRENC